MKNTIFESSDSVYTSTYTSRVDNGLLIEVGETKQPVQ